MFNLFFDLLPCEIRHYIYQIRLSNILIRTYYRRCTQKLALAYSVILLRNTYNPYFHNHRYPYYLNPENKFLSYLIHKCSKIITKHDDKVWWLSQLIRPVEHGLILHYSASPSYYYQRTQSACNQLLSIFHVSSYQHRFTTLLS